MCLLAGTLVVPFLQDFLKLTKDLRALNISFCRALDLRRLLCGVIPEHCPKLRSLDLSYIDVSTTFSARCVCVGGWRGEEEEQINNSECPHSFFIAISRLILLDFSLSAHWSKTNNSGATRIPVVGKWSTFGTFVFERERFGRFASFMRRICSKCKRLLIIVPVGLSRVF